MNIEEKVFRRKRFITERLIEYGFKADGEGLKYEADFMGGDFHAIITVSKDGQVCGSVIDVMNDEEYAQLRMDNLNGAFVSQVRSEYEKLLEDISAKCCISVLFVSEQSNRIARLIFEKYGVEADFPFKQNQYKDIGAFRHTDSGKWFALFMNIRWSLLLKDENEANIDIVNLKIDPQDKDALVDGARIFPAYHMSHKNWISAVLNDSLSDEEVMQLIEKSYELT